MPAAPERPSLGLFSHSRAKRAARRAGPSPDEASTTPVNANREPPSIQLQRFAAKQLLPVESLDDHNRQRFTEITRDFLAAHARTWRAAGHVETPQYILKSRFVAKAEAGFYADQARGLADAEERAKLFESDKHFIAAAEKRANNYPEIYFAIGLGREFSDIGNMATGPDLGAAHFEASDVIESDLLSIYGRALTLTALDQQQRRDGQHGV